ncbi:hypothetical protein CHS0354_006081 [Potamilus streckersoni]|uniref:Alpha-1,6-mannosyl-glycoprotein 2-beta-N-acetylglucosaminyltransferase n=1 Tax=Potamilus streckersoni TaxID=2493646 RepID=A0AAE0SU59_9BIVA|nr:hypothetical protein CHS0354_006081 [Potamilus streckersoni]
MRMRRVVRFTFMVVLIMFVLLNLLILFSVQTEIPDGSRRLNSVNSFAHHHQGDRFHLQDSDSIVSVENQVWILPHMGNGTYHEPMNVSGENLTHIKNEIQRINSQQFIHNLDKFGLKLNTESVVIVIQVHDRGEYLKILLNSLRKVANIEKSLLIISHDVYSNELNQLVLSVDFCPVMQIFFPHSLQLHPKEFPGEHPNDCPRNIKKEEAVLMKCNNANSPDKYGHYREARYCQTKHHWFWKLYHTFEKVQVMKNYQGLVLLLEEDYYVTPDVISVLQMMHNLMKKDCKDCTLLAAGNYDKSQNYGLNSGKVEVANWISSKHNMGMSFTVDLWKEIKRCGKEFCLFDDYNWDWTLQHLSSQCIKQQIKVLKMKATRVFHMGDCGVHHKGKNCQPANKEKTVEQEVQSNKQHLFPNSISIGSYSGLKLRDPKPNGGWGDSRDHQLCLSFIQNTTIH